MKLTHLQIHNFKNYANVELNFSEQIICFTGENGQGKTNLLDAIHYLSMTKSFINHNDSQNINYNEKFFRISGNFQNDDCSFHNVTCFFDVNSGKKITINNKTCERFSDVIGQYPVIIIAPQDFLIIDSVEYRRKFFDSFISQYDKKYLNELFHYNRILQQRNALLKKKESAHLMTLLETYDIQLAQAGQHIYEKRVVFAQEFQQIFRNHYIFNNQNELPAIRFKSQFDGKDYFSLLRDNTKNDLHVGFTTFGIHRDDFEFELNNMPLKKFASQGQQKSFLIALKTTQFEFLKKKLDKTPILLFDDIHDRLDQRRLHNLHRFITNNLPTQIFITHTNKEQLEKFLLDFPTKPEFFHIHKGTIEKR